MLIPVIFSLVVIFITILIHGIGTSWGLNYLSRNKHLTSNEISFKDALNFLSFTAIFLMLLHFIEILVWAVVFMIIPDVHQLQSLEESIYFSLVTYATLGYGDITLGPYWRLMSGFEAMDGILLFGWSTAMFFSVFQKIIVQIKIPGQKPGNP